MKRPLLLIGFFLIVLTSNAQIGLHNVYSSYLFSARKKTSSIKNSIALTETRLDTIFVKDRPMFSKYISKRKDYRTIILADNSFLPVNAYGNRISSEIDLERSKNRAKLLFFKMKMWRYFR